ncbi:MAG: cytochrome c-type biogenesis protein CcmH [Actinomycetia bacterium]|nr:cytochrome c-type biogenesis protein CcmH [Actinomycetes bacterium]
MKLKVKALFVILAILMTLQALTVSAFALEVNDVAGEFICNCGCNKLLSACEMECGDQLRGFIKERIDMGLGKNQIMQYMKVNFNQAILAAPEKKGFNLTAWLTPFVFVIIGAVITRRVVGSWVVRHREDDDDGDDDNSGGKPTKKTKVDKKYDDQVKKELEEFGW